MNRSRFTLIIPVMLAAACGGDKDPAPDPYPRIDDARPVDGPYYVSVANTFGDKCYVKMIPSDGPVYTVDVLHLPDGALNVNLNAMIVGTSVLERVVHDRGNVDHEQTYAPAFRLDGEEPPEHVVTARGYLTPDAIDLTIESREDECVATSVIKGAPRPIRDAAALDGFYALTMGDLGSVCPGTEAPAPSEWRDVINLTDTGVSANVSLDLGGGLYLTVPRPAADGRVDWNGTFVWVFDEMFVFEMTGTLTGTLRPDLVDLTLEYDSVEYPSECPWFLAFKGKKRLPAFDAADNDYRLHVDVTTTCPEEGEEPSWSLERTATVITQADGSIVLKDFTGAYPLTLDEGAFAVEYGTGSTFTVGISGTVAPPHLDYAYVVQEFDEAGAVTCRIDATVAGLVRYVFE